MGSETSFKEIYKVSKKVFEFAELGSAEFNTSAFLADFLTKNHFTVKIPYKGMKTSFRAEYGSGKPEVCFLCEEDALPNGHSCGHNLIAAWAVGSAVRLKEKGYKGRIVVIGTPSEEGIGEYAGSKDRLVKAGAFKDIDFALGFHPDSRWNVGCISPLNVDLELTFIGKASHITEAGKGRNALDALVDAYTMIRKLASSSPKSEHVVIGMFVKEGGSAANVIPEKAVLEIDLRSMNERSFRSIYNRVIEIAKRSGKRYGVKVKLEKTTPLYQKYENPVFLDEILFNNLKKRGIIPVKLYSGRKLQIGATDEANVSRVVPTCHIDMKIAPENIAGHSSAFRDYAGSESALTSLKTAIEATVESCIEISNDKELLKRIPIS